MEPTMNLTELYGITAQIIATLAVAAAVSKRFLKPKETSQRIIFI